MSPYLRFRDIVKSYDGQNNAIDGVSIDIARHEFVTFLGPSGSGKTTALMMIAGFENPTSGQIELEGHDLTRRKPYQRNIGFVFQNYALFPHMTVARNVGFPLRMRGIPGTDILARVERMLSLVKLQGLANRYPKELSGGQQQRVALARALVFNPNVLLLDEPLGALDRNLREQMQIEIKQIHQEVGSTTIYVTHDQTEAMTMSDRVAVFRQGKLEQIASPLEIYERPATRFVGEFVGDSNFLTGRIDSTCPECLSVPGIGAVRVMHPAGDATQHAGEVDMLVRPEHMRLIDEGASVESLNTVRMRVDGIVNYGDSVLVMGVANGHPLRIRVATKEVACLAEGMEVTVGWAPENAYVVPHS